MRVLVTGGTGFLGQHVCTGLHAQGFSPIVCSHTTASFMVPSARMVSCNLLDSAAVNALCATTRPTHILHLAWGMGTPGEYWFSPENLRWLAASQHLMRVFAAHGGTRFVGVGTGVEYSPVQEIRDEQQTPTTPDTLYGQAKLACGNALHAHSAALGFSSAWARLFYLLGPGEAPHRLIPSASRVLGAGGTFTYNAGACLDYLDVRDAARALICLLFSDTRGTINIASGQGLPLQTLLQKFIYTNRLHGDIQARTGEKAIQIVGSATRLRRELAYTPMYSLEQSLRDSYICYHSTNEDTHAST